MVLASSLADTRPLVTVVIPTYNRLALVQQAIASVIAQTYTEWELIIADDGSVDGTAEFIRSMNNPRIKILELGHVGNIAMLRNAGVNAGSGSWIAFLDSDDEWIPRKLEIQLNRMLPEKKRWGYGRFELMDHDGYPIPLKAGEFRPLSGWITKEVLTTEASVNIGTLMVERNLFEEAGGFNIHAGLLYREDYEFVLRLSLKAEVYAIPELLLRVREHRSRITNSFEYGHDRTAFVYEYFMRSKPEKEFAILARRRLATETAEAAIKNIQQGKYLHATRKLGKALLLGDKWRHLISVVRRGIFITRSSG